ncbi:MAG: TonB family protein [Acidobacteriales bacterium]|nr:TonB family protein [Terriglobales bacterium]
MLRARLDSTGSKDPPARFPEASAARIQHAAPTSMTQRPMFRPDAFEDSPSPEASDKNKKNQRDAGTGIRLSHVQSHFTAAAAGSTNVDRALDLVLNEIVEQARLATTATGAAVALKDEHDMVCRATTGATAPDIAVRVNTRAGISGACVRTKEVQRCNDTESDERVDKEACRQLGVRSILIAPVMKNEEVLGVLEIFSPRPNAFADRDVLTLQALARRIVMNIDRAHQTMTSGSLTVTPSFKRPEMRNEVTPVDLPQPEAQKETQKAAWPRLEVYGNGKAKPGHSRETSSIAAKFSAGIPVIIRAKDARNAEKPVAGEEHVSKMRRLIGDYWTLLLTVAVVAVALFLGWMLGRAGWQKAASRHEAASAAMTSQPKQSSPVESQPPAAPALVLDTTPSPDGPSDKLVITHIAPSTPHASRGEGKIQAETKKVASAQQQPAKKDSENASSELVIFQDDKIIYPKQAAKQPGPGAKTAATPEPPAPEVAKSDTRKASAPKSEDPANTEDQRPTGPVQISSDAANKALVKRIEPRYPEEARAQRIQGNVILDVIVGKDGQVHGLNVIRGDSDLAAAASAAVGQWRFKPLMRSGQPEEFETKVSVNFSLP